jgi:hypothetical protein
MVFTTIRSFFQLAPSNNADKTFVEINAIKTSDYGEDKMKTRQTFISLIVIAVVCAAFIWLTVSYGVEKSIEVESYNLPEYRSDTVRAIDAYQQMINRMLDDNDRNWGMVQEQLNTINGKLDTVLSDLDSISQRIARIEKKMGIEEPEENEPKPGELQPDKMTQSGNPAEIYRYPEINR